MLIEDLMVGDYVYNNLKQVCKVFAITGLGIPYIQVDNFSTDDGCFEIGLCTEYSGIPLTPEILEKNGFTKELDADELHYRFTLIDENIKFSVLYARSVFQWLGPLDFKYVHELQHALRLCGINKEIEL